MCGRTNVHVVLFLAIILTPKKAASALNTRSFNSLLQLEKEQNQS